MVGDPGDRIGVEEDDPPRPAPGGPLGDRGRQRRGAEPPAAADDLDRERCHDDQHSVPGHGTRDRPRTCGRTRRRRRPCGRTRPGPRPDPPPRIPHRRGKAAAPVGGRPGPPVRRSKGGRPVHQLVPEGSTSIVGTQGHLAQQQGPRRAGRACLGGPQPAREDRVGDPGALRGTGRHGVAQHARARARRRRRSRSCRRRGRRCRPVRRATRSPTPAPRRRSGSRPQARTRRRSMARATSPLPRVNGRTVTISACTMAATTPAGRVAERATRSARSSSRAGNSAARSSPARGRSARGSPRRRPAAARARRRARCPPRRRRAGARAPWRGARRTTPARCSVSAVAAIASPRPPRPGRAPEPGRGLAHEVADDLDGQPGLRRAQRSPRTPHPGLGGRLGDAPSERLVPAQGGARLRAAATAGTRAGRRRARRGRRRRRSRRVRQADSRELAGLRDQPPLESQTVASSSMKPPETLPGVARRGATPRPARPARAR